MSTIETVKVKADNVHGYKIINASAFDPQKHKLADGKETPKDNRSRREKELEEHFEAQRRFEANRGQVAGQGPIDSGLKNPSGTFSEPTPTDVRYPDEATEFENNKGAFINRSAADLRKELGLPDAPGGIVPVVAEAVRKVDTATAEAQAAVTAAQKDAFDPVTGKVKPETQKPADGEQTETPQGDGEQGEGLQSGDEGDTGTPSFAKRGVKK